MDFQPHTGALARQRLIIVTGKGGVGKSTIAAAMARRWAIAGEKILLTAQTGRTLDRLFDARTTYESVQIAENFWLSELNAHAALKEYAHRNALIPGFYNWFLDNKALRQFTEAAPGFEELMCLGKIYDACTSGRFDRVVFDAPSTGHAALMLRVPRVIANAVSVGQLHHNALKIQLMLENDAHTSVVTVSLPEEMSVREALELRATLRRESNLQPGPVVLNRVRAQLFTAAEVAALDAIPTPSAALERMVHAARSRFELSSAQSVHVAELTRRVENVTCVTEVIRDRHDPAALLNTVAAHLEPLMGSA